MLITKNNSIELNLSNKNISTKLLQELKHELIKLDIDLLKLNEVIQTESITLNLDAFTDEEDLTLEHLIEAFFQSYEFNFQDLPLYTEGESKIIRALNDKIVVELFKPTVYSYTSNRYGIAEGTDNIRAKFTSAVFRKMQQEKYKAGGRVLGNAFLAMKETKDGIFIIQRKIQCSNLEVRIKRYHVGSPVHRYKYTEQKATVRRGNKPLVKWDRFENPLVCFDWRNPLTDDEGKRLADEPISDDYAGVWIANVSRAKELCRDTFIWLENKFKKKGLTLIDICFFVDQSGEYIYGEISPDCMRVRTSDIAAKDGQSFDKDLWRNGKTEAVLLDKYSKLYNLFTH